jgi:hypothetical protein
MMSLKSLHHGDSHPSGTMSSRLTPLRMTPSLYHSEEPFGSAKDPYDDVIEIVES